MKYKTQSNIKKAIEEIKEIQSKMDKAIKEIKNTLNQNSFAKTQDKNQQDYINNQNSASNSNYSNSTNATNKNEKLEDYIGYLIVTNDLNTKEWWVEKYNESQLAVNKDNLVAKHQELQKTNPVYNAKKINITKN